MKRTVQVYLVLTAAAVVSTACSSSKSPVPISSVNPTGSSSVAALLNRYDGAVSAVNGAFSEVEHDIQAVNQSATPANLTQLNTSCNKALAVSIRNTRLPSVPGHPAVLSDWDTAMKDFSTGALECKTAVKEWAGSAAGITELVTAQHWITAGASAEPSPASF